MSVINSMLKSIQQRTEPQASNKNEQGIILEPVYDYQSIMIKVVVGCIAAAIILWGYFYLTKQPEPASIEASYTLQQPSINKAHVIEPKEGSSVSKNTAAPRKVDNLNDAPAVVALQSSKPVTTVPVTSKVISEPAPLKVHHNEVKSSSPKMVKRQVSQPSLDEQLATTLKAAKQALEFGLYQEAQSDLVDILQRDPGHIEARSLLAASYIQQQNIIAAQNILEEGIAYDSQVLEWRVLLSKIVIKRNQYDAVLALLSDEFDSQATNHYWILKASAQQQLNKHQQALVSFEHLTELQPSQGKWWLAMATSKDALQDYYHAKQYYQAAITTGGLSPALLSHAEQRLTALKGVL